MRRVAPPGTLAELWLRARALTGRSVADVASHLNARVPATLHRDKGFIGELTEAALGAHAPGRSEPDFPDLGVELKTIPVHPDGEPTASTWVGAAPGGDTWETSHTRRKLASVLWIPVTEHAEVGARTYLAPRFWRPDPEEEALLRADWEAAVERLALGEAAALRSHHGQALQIRPKAANREVLEWAVDADGEWIRRTPVGWYLRREFTSRILVEPDTFADRLRRRGLGLADDALRLDAWRPDWGEAGVLAVAHLAAHGVRAWHIGSTAVPHLRAKPILDLVAERGDEGALTAAAAALGLHDRGEHGIPDRRYFTLRAGALCVAHLHAFPAGDARIAAHRRWARALHADPTLAAAYEAEKLRVSAEVGRAAYASAKAPWMSRARLPEDV